jgi:SHS2 domain-containing protein
MHETFEHTADLGLRVRAASLNQLFEEMALALFSAIIENPQALAANERLEVELRNNDLELLLFDWLRELLYHFDAAHRLFGRFQVELGEKTLYGIAWGERLDPARHVLLHEVKAITYHGLRVAKEQDGWLAEVIVDI